MPQWVGFNTLAAGVFGLILGSFLNVVIYRLPKILERQWRRECAELSGSPLPEGEPFNLMVPRSHCPHCGHRIAWYENIPIFSYLFLRGRCSGCHAPISPRYPLIELFTGLCFAFCGWRWGWTPTTLAWCGFSAALITLTMIDWDTTLLPDDITLPLLWGGLLASLLGWTATPLRAALWGATAGYLSLWLIYQIFKLLTGKEGMGYGDFKLFAALGAWLGVDALIPVILPASISGLIVGLILKARRSLREGGAVPFGPFLAFGGLTVAYVGPRTLLNLLGLA